MKAARIICLLGYGLTYFAFALDNDSTHEVRLKIGRSTVVGRYTPETNTTSFLGIPYAVPPVGERRWKAPLLQPLQDGEINATEFGPACHAGFGFSVVRSPEPTSEDCLYLNIYFKGRSPPVVQKPVMVYIHGGGFMVGSSSNEATSPSPEFYVQEEDVIYVSLNYRQVIQASHGYTLIINFNVQARSAGLPRPPCDA